MTDRAQSLLREALSLSEEERADLVAEFLVSLEDPPEMTWRPSSKRGLKSSSNERAGFLPAKRMARSGARSVTVSAGR